MKIFSIEELEQLPVGSIVRISPRNSNHDKKERNQNYYFVWLGSLNNENELTVSSIQRGVWKISPDMLLAISDRKLYGFTNLVWIGAVRADSGELVKVSELEDWPNVYTFELFEVEDLCSLLNMAANLYLGYGNLHRNGIDDEKKKMGIPFFDVQS